MVLLMHDAFAERAGSRASFTRTGWVGGEYVAMGMVGSVLANDVFSIYWNPAGLNELQRKKKLSQDDVLERAREGRLGSIRERDLLDFSEDKSDALFWDIGLSGSMLSEGRNAAFAGTAFGLFNGVFGAGIYYFGTEDIYLFNEAGIPQGTTNYISSVTYVSYAWSANVTDIGITAKGLYEKIDDTSYVGGGFDLGVKIAVLPFLTIGFTAIDIGVGLLPLNTEHNVKQTYDLAYPSLNFGAAFTADSGLVLAANITKRLEQTGYIYSGGIKYPLARNMNVFLGMSAASFSSGVSFSLGTLNIAYGMNFDNINNDVNNTVSVSLLF